ARKDARRAESRAIAERSRSRCVAPEPIACLSPLDVLIEWYPARRSLPGLSADLDALKREIEDNGGSIGEAKEPELVGYKPERRAVLRWGGVYLKVYADDAEFQAAASAMRASARVPGLSTPRPIAARAADRLTAQASLDVSSAAPPSRTEVGKALA